MHLAIMITRKEDEAVFNALELWKRYKRRKGG